jgi:hypothetical protein
LVFPFVKEEEFSFILLCNFQYDAMTMMMMMKKIYFSITKFNSSSRQIEIIDFIYYSIEWMIRCVCDIEHEQKTKDISAN